jgi:DNA-binding IclR family transcriptional regulator
MGRVSPISHETVETTTGLQSAPASITGRFSLAADNEGMWPGIEFIAAPVVSATGFAVAYVGASGPGARIRLDTEKNLKCRIEEYVAQIPQVPGPGTEQTEFSQNQEE